MARLPAELHPQARSLGRVLWGQRVWVDASAMRVDAAGNCYLDPSAPYATSRARAGARPIEVSRRRDGFHVYAGPHLAGTWQPDRRVARGRAAVVPVARVHTGFNLWDYLASPPPGLRIVIAAALAATPLLLMWHGIGAAVAGVIAAVPGTPALAGAVERWLSRWGPGWAAQADTSILFPAPQGPSAPPPSGPDQPSAAAPSPDAPPPPPPPPPVQVIVNCGGAASVEQPQPAPAAPSRRAPARARASAAVTAATAASTRRERPPAGPALAAWPPAAPSRRATRGGRSGIE